jgi:hypothetical protein
VPRNKEWRQLHDEELHSYFSPIIIKVINKIEWNETSRHVVCMEVRTAFWWWKTKVRTHRRPWRTGNKNI